MGVHALLFWSQGLVQSLEVQMPPTPTFENCPEKRKIAASILEFWMERSKEKNWRIWDPAAAWIQKRRGKK